MRTAIVTGITGQDGSYLAEMLLAKGYRVHGVARTSSGDRRLSRQLLDQIELHRFPLDDAQRWKQLMGEVQPQEFYHLAADSFVPNGWSDPVGNIESNLALTVRILEAVRTTVPEARFLNACSREVFGAARHSLASEETPMQPVTPYGINKAASRHFGRVYREQHQMFVANAILFNHESPRRPVEFVTRKISFGAARIALGLDDRLELGDLSARRDWGYAPDFVDGMWRMLQLDQPQDFVLGTGQLYSIAEFAEYAFSAAGIDWKRHVVSRATFLRQSDTAALAADNAKAQALLDWRPSITLPQLAERMVLHDLAMLQQQAAHSRRAA
ncbi:MAG: GDP-mannose 4,6-dehydratase [Planctomycetales bacterium]|nr:GDP-mannose 4,6-dehydratase [Planctomycetales bacterium]